MNSYEIIANEVMEYVEYQTKHDRVIDAFYIVHFYQKYDWSDKWEECTEIVELVGPPGDVNFMMDFCEGQTDVKDVTVISLLEIGDILKRFKELYI